MARRGRLRVIVSVGRDRSLRRTELAYLCFVLAELSTWIALLVHAYERGGVSETGVVGAVLLAPAAIVAPLASFAGDRFDRRRVVAISYLLQAVACVVTAVAIASGAPSPVVYAGGALLCAVVTFSRPAIGALLPNLSRSAEQLAAANVVLGIVHSTGLFAGPVLAGVVLHLASPAAVLFLGAGVLVVGALLAGGVEQVAGSTHDDPIGFATVGSEALAGLALLRRQRGPRVLIGLLALVTVLEGAADVTAVAVALELFARGEGSAGLLSASGGVGAMLGSAAAVSVIGRRRLSPTILGGALLRGLPFAALAAAGELWIAVVLFAVGGIGASITDTAGQTLLQGITPDDVMARVFGLLEGMRMVALATGSLAVSALAATIGLRPAFVAVGLLVPAVVLSTLPTIAALDRRRHRPDPQLLALVRSIPIFALLPAYTLEQIVGRLLRRTPAAGSTIIAVGDHGDELFILAAGQVEVIVGDRTRLLDTPGEYFGELALLRDVPRSATVVAGDGVVVYALERDVFLEAVTGHPRSLARAQRGIDQLPLGPGAMPGG